MIYGECLRNLFGTCTFCFADTSIVSFFAVRRKMQFFCIWKICIIWRKTAFRKLHYLWKTVFSFPILFMKYVMGYYLKFLSDELWNKLIFNFANYRSIAFCKHVSLGILFLKSITKRRILSIKVILKQNKI